MEIRWSKRSIKKISEIGDFIALDSASRAKSFVSELVKSVERLKEFPESGPIIIENPAFRQIVFKKYRLIYRLKNKRIEIVTNVSPKEKLKL